MYNTCSFGCNSFNLVNSSFLRKIWVLAKKLVLSEEAFVNLGFHQTTSDNLKNIISITKFSNIDKNVVINKLSDRFYEIKYKYHFILYPKTMQFVLIMFLIFENSANLLGVYVNHFVAVKKSPLTSSVMEIKKWLRVCLKPLG